MALDANRLAAGRESGQFFLRPFAAPALINGPRSRYSAPSRHGGTGLLLTITLLVALTIAGAAHFLAPATSEHRIRFRTEPDAPAAFGYNMAWLAIRTRDTAGVAEALGLIGPSPCNWSSGIGTVYDDELGQSHVYVTPPVGPWTFVVGLALPQPLGRSFNDKCTPLLVSLAGRYPEVQYFCCYAPLDSFSWARLADGRLLRAFAIGDEGVIWSKGRTTREEKALGLKLFELRGVKGRKGDAGGEIILHPTEEHVMRLAQSWSHDPTTLEAARTDPALGLIAFAPATWRAERARKAA